MITPKKYFNGYTYYLSDIVEFIYNNKEYCRGE